MSMTHLPCPRLRHTLFLDFEKGLHSRTTATSMLDARMGQLCAFHGGLATLLRAVRSANGAKVPNQFHRVSTASTTSATTTSAPVSGAVLATINRRTPVSNSSSSSSSGSGSASSATGTWTEEHQHGSVTNVGWGLDGEDLGRPVAELASSHAHKADQKHDDLFQQALGTPVSGEASGEGVVKLQHLLTLPPPRFPVPLGDEWTTGRPRDSWEPAAAAARTAVLQRGTAVDVHGKQTEASIAAAAGYITTLPVGVCTGAGGTVALSWGATECPAGTLTQPAYHAAVHVLPVLAGQPDWAELDARATRVLDRIEECSQRHGGDGAVLS